MEKTSRLLYQLVHSLNANNIEVSIKLKPEPWDSILGSHVDGKDLAFGPSSASFPTHLQRVC